MVSVYLKLALAAAFPVAASALFYLLETKSAFGRLKKNVRQLIIGVVFGGIAVLGTEFGISGGGATMNVRDAAPLCAGLIFGAPAGLIAGVIGGVERYFATLWGAGAYTRVACSVSTALAGLFGAILRKYMFDDKKPTALYGLAIAIVMEVIHMLMLFVTNMNDIHRAFTVVSLCTVPMVSMNGLSVMASVLCVSLLGHRRTKAGGQKKISQTVQRWLLLCIIIAFLATSVFTFFVQTSLSDGDAKNLLSLNLSDVRADISDASDRNLLALTRTVANRINISGTRDAAFLEKLASDYSVTEIDVVGPDGVITASTNEAFVGYDMASGEQSAAFLVLLNGASEYVQRYQPISYDASLSRKYGGVVLNGGGFVQVGYDADRFQRDIDAEVVGAAVNRHVGQSGSVIICDEHGKIVSDSSGSVGQSLDSTGIRIESSTPADSVFAATVYGNSSLCMYTVSEGYTIIAALPENEATFSRNVAVYVMGFMEIIVFATMFALIYFLIKKLVVENIQRINGTLSQITGGNLNVTVDVRSNQEFSSLSDDINATVVTLKRYIAEAAARIDKELEFAKDIQHSALPSVFPPYPNRKEFDIYAEMATAKEVGGDFYDFYMIGEDTLAFLIADVSGKGIPAAMFMMTSKTLIKSFAEAGSPVSDVFTKANAELCANNEAGMFVTAWMGLIDLKTGLITYANAGHNPPLLRHADGTSEYIKSRAGFVLAGMEGVKYRRNELQLQKGDTLFLYTDGVTEATDKDEALFGEDRLLSVLTDNPNSNVTSLIKSVKTAVDAFAGEMPQFDDITMLSLHYRGKEPDLTELTVIPSLDSLEEVTEFVEKTFTELALPPALVMKMNIAVDELYSNIVRYSCAKSVSVACGVENGEALLRFCDNGKPYDPTRQEDPDVTLSAEERGVGGLGIYMVKKSMDSIDYEYRNDENVLLIKKRI